MNWVLCLKPPVPSRLLGEFRAVDLVNHRRLDELNGTVLRPKTTLSEVKKRKSFPPICCSCKKIRNDEGCWPQVESYIGQQADVQFSHGLCPECSDEYHRQIDEMVAERGKADPEEA